MFVRLASQDSLPSFHLSSTLNSDWAILLVVKASKLTKLSISTPECVINLDMVICLSVLLLK